MVNGQTVYVPEANDNGRFISITRDLFADTGTGSRPTSSKESVVFDLENVNDSNDDNY